LKRVRREEKLDKDFDMDFGIGDLPGPTKPSQPNDVSSGGLKDKHDPYLAGSAASLKDMDLQPPPGAMPYLVPKANVSRESLHSLSDPRDNPYGAIYSSRPPSPSGTFSPFSDQHSISGRSTRNLLAPSSQIDENNPNSPFKPPPRVPSPLGISEIPTGPRDLSPTKMLANALSEIPAPPVAYSPSKSPSHSPIREPASVTQGRAERNGFDPNTTSSSISPVVPVESFNNVQPTVIPEKTSPVTELQYPIPTSSQNTLLKNTAYQIPNHEVFDSTGRSQGPLNEEALHGEHLSPQANEVYLRNETWEDDPAFQRTNDVGHRNTEENEDHAKRIQSVYNEYWNDGGYYDGSEEWGSLPQYGNTESQYQSKPAMAENYNGTGRRDSPQDYYERDNWTQEPTPQDSYYYHDGYPNTQNAHDGVGLGINGHLPSPQARPSNYSRPSTSYSTSSLPSRARTPSKPLEPLNDLPAARYKLDDLASPISFSKPRRFVGSAGRASPMDRPASPAQVLGSSWSHLSELPVPHRLRRSGSFSSIDFAPVRKYAGSEVDAGDTGSIRSLARTEASLMAVSAGSGRVNRLPQDLVPMGKGGALSTLRPQNYDNIRYV